MRHTTKNRRIEESNRTSVCKNKNAVLCAAIVGAAVASFSTAQGAIRTWDAGGADQKFSNSANWNADTLPISGTDSELVFANTQDGLTLDSDMVGLAVSRITFNNPAPSYTIGGSQAITMEKGTSQLIIFNNATSSTQTFNVGLISQNSGNNIELDVTSGSKIHLAGQVSGSGGITVGTGTHTGGYVILSNSSNSYGRSTIINNGILRLDSPTALPTTSSMVIFNNIAAPKSILGITFDFQREIVTSSASTPVGKIRIGGGNAGFAAYGGTRTLTLGANSSSNFTWGSNITSAGIFLMGSADSDGTLDFLNPISPSATGYTATFDVDNGTGTLGGRLSGNISGSLSFKKIGTGTLEMIGSSNTYTGTTNVAVGKLLINGNNTGTGAVTVGTATTSATLGGVGVIAGAVSVMSSSALSPGASIESLDTGALSFADGANFEVEANASVSKLVGADAVNVTGALTLGGTVKLNLLKLGTGSFDNATTFTLIGYNGTLSGGGLFSVDNGATTLADGAQFSFGGTTWAIDYDSSTLGDNSTYAAAGTKYVNITTAIPEPTSAAGILVAGSLLALRRKNRVRNTW